MIFEVYLLTFFIFYVRVKKEIKKRENSIVLEKQSYTKVQIFNEKNVYI